MEENKNLTELVFILDESGSMSGLRNETIKGFNSLIEKQLTEEGETLVSLVLFSDSSTKVYERINIKEIKQLTEKDYAPDGCTALLDTLGSTINITMRHYDQLKDEEKPNKTLFVVITDGLENASIEYKYKDVKKLIEESKEKNFEYIFIGANIDSEEEAHKLGIDKDHAVNYISDGTGIKVVYDCVGEACLKVRRNCKVGSSWRSDIDEDLKKRKNKKK